MRFSRFVPRPDRTGRSAARVLLALALVLGLWAIVVLLTGGIRFEAAGLTISSRNPTRPAFVAVLLAIAAWSLDRRYAEALVAEYLSVLSGVTTRFAAPAAALALLAAGLQFGARAASGSDESGYLSQSVLWLRGDLRIELPIAASLPWPEADWTLMPLGYRPVEDHVLVPTYPAGLPLMMAGARLISACAPFLIVPICSALLVLFTWLLGRRLFGEAPAASGAVILAVSPVVLVMTLTPMTDVPVSMFWMASLLAADLATARSAAAAGVLAGVAAVIRPNLAPLAFFPLLLTAVHGGGRRAVLTRGALLSAAVAPFAVFIAVLHNELYGSPFASGYGDPSSLYSLAHLPVNARFYLSSWSLVHGVLGWLFIPAIFRPRPAVARARVRVAIAFAIAVGLLYAFYLPHGDWRFLRFVLPAAPIVFLLTADAAAWIGGRFGPTAAAGALAAVTLLAIIRGVDFSAAQNTIANAAGDQRYVDGATYVDAHTPQDAVILVMQHSGSVRYYSGRLILRYDYLNPAWLDRAVRRLEDLGLSTYALLEDWEEDIVRKRFASQRTLRAFDAGPLAIRRHAGGELRFYALRAPGTRPGGPPARMPRTSPGDCPPPSPQLGHPAGAQPRTASR